MQNFLKKCFIIQVNLIFNIKEKNRENLRANRKVTEFKPKKGIKER